MLTAAESYFVDGFNPRTNTVYEFHGCFYHGCVKCFKNSRHQRRNCHSDRTVDEASNRPQNAEFKTRWIQSD